MTEIKVTTKKVKPPVKRSYIPTPKRNREMDIAQSKLIRRNMFFGTQLLEHAARVKTLSKSPKGRQILEQETKKKTKKVK